MEDERAIERLIASYGPLVDAGDAESAGQLWSIDGSYDVETWHMGSRADIEEMVRSEAHRGLIEQGCSHFLGPAVVTVSGDDAVAVCESILLTHSGGGFRVLRAGANHFTLRRIDEQWQIAVRTTMALDGQAGARALLADGVAGR